MHVAFRAVESIVTPVPLNVTAAGSSAVQQPGVSILGAIALITDRAAIYKCSGALPQLFAGKGNLNRSLKIFRMSSDNFWVLPLIPDTSPYITQESKRQQ